MTPRKKRHPADYPPGFVGMTPRPRTLTPNGEVYLLATVPDVGDVLLPKGIRSKEWLNDRGIAILVVEVMDAPQTVHAVRWDGSDLHFCHHLAPSLVKWRIPYEKALIPTLDPVSCQTCRRNVASEPDATWVSVFRAPWDSDNIPEDRRYGGSDYPN